MPALESLLERLALGQVEFVIVGGFAAVAHGVSMLTQDVDICCPFSAPNLARLQQALADLHPFHRMTPARLPLHISAEDIGHLKNLYLMTDWGQLDCLGQVKGVGDYAAVRAASVEVRLPHGPCRVLGIEGLIEAKLAIGETRDKLTVIQLQAIRERMRAARKPRE